MNYQVYYSKDLGKTWAIINKAVYSWDWGDAGLGDVPESRIYVIATENGATSRNFYQSDNFGGSYELLVAGAYRAIFLDKQIFVAAVIFSQINPPVRFSTQQSCH